MWSHNDKDAAFQLRHLLRKESFSPEHGGWRRTARGKCDRCGSNAMNRKWLGGIGVLKGCDVMVNLEIRTDLTLNFLLVEKASQLELKTHLSEVYSVMFVLCVA